MSASEQVVAVVGEDCKTFNGSSGVNVTNNTLTVSSHGYNTGDVIIYDRNNGTIVTGLTNYSPYYVIVVNSNTIKLATSATNANSRDSSRSYCNWIWNTASL